MRCPWRSVRRWRRRITPEPYDVMSWGFRWRPYVPVAQRRAKAARELAKAAKKGGKQADPVVLTGRAIASSFWGKAWCDNLEAYSDFENRLPRGRTYVRNGSVVDLQIGPGSVTARVSGSDLYRVQIDFRPLAKNVWESVRKECAGRIDSILDLLQGRLSAAVMEVVTRPKNGLFPTPREIRMKCSCPDWAEMCKHVAATLYGVGSRLDTHPELLFLLRGIDPEELIDGVSGADALRSSTVGNDKAGLGDADLSAVFGIELDRETAAGSAPPPLPPLPPSPPPVGGAPAVAGRSRRPTARKVKVVRTSKACSPSTPTTKTKTEPKTKTSTARKERTRTRSFR